MTKVDSLRSLGACGELVEPMTKIDSFYSHGMTKIDSLRTFVELLSNFVELADIFGTCGELVESMTKFNSSFNRL